MNEKSVNQRRNTLLGVGAGVLLAVFMLLIFLFGIFIGRRQSRFLPHFGQLHMNREFYPREFGHGAMGTVETVGDNSMVVRDKAGALRTILIDNQTQIRRGMTNIKFSEIKIGEQVVILGEPQEEEGAIKAKLIRSLGD